jgi:HAD superfamily hydrolase (TIGR01509 family)
MTDNTRTSMPFQGVIFDMDGTLIEPLLDFPRLRSELGIPPEAGILEALDAMDPGEAAPRRRVLLQHELLAAGKADLLPGTVETLQAIRAAGLKTALLTRSAAEAMALVIERFSLRFDLAWSRENGPIKPEPDGILRACRRLGVAPPATACVGDFRYDLLAANAAGAVAILLARGPMPDFAHLARHVITELDQLPALLGI